MVIMFDSKDNCDLNKLKKRWERIQQKHMQKYEKKVKNKLCV